MCLKTTLDIYICALFHYIVEMWMLVDKFVYLGMFCDVNEMTPRCEASNFILADELVTLVFREYLSSYFLIKFRFSLHLQSYLYILVGFVPCEVDLLVSHMQECVMYMWTLPYSHYKLNSKRCLCVGLWCILEYRAYWCDNLLITS